MVEVPKLSQALGEVGNINGSTDCLSRMETRTKTMKQTHMQSMAVRMTKLAAIGSNRLPDGYELEGPMINRPIKGGMVMLRGAIKTNLGEVMEFFNSSQITDVTPMAGGLAIKTLASEWVIRYL